MYRVGSGYDVHRLVEGLPLRVGGVDIAHHKGLEAHSDGDVLIHALCDALLGAAALGDIGAHFPDSDPAYRGADSRELLAKVCELIRSSGYEVVNADCTIVAQCPKFLPYIARMKEVLGLILGISPTESLNVKATTTERLGFEGREEGISSICTVLLKKNVK